VQRETRRNRHRHVGVPVFDLSGEFKRDIAGRFVAKLIDIRLGIRRNENLELTMLIARFPHDHLAVFEVNLSVDELLAPGAHAARQLIED
jgi:hypothetical protein